MEDGKETSLPDELNVTNNVDVSRRPCQSVV